MLERLNSEIRRGGKVVRMFPSEQSTLLNLKVERECTHDPFVIDDAPMEIDHELKMRSRIVWCAYIDIVLHTH